MIVVFNTSILFDKLVINAWHHNGGLIYASSKDVKIYTSLIEITDTIFDAPIANSTLIFDGLIPQHVGQNIADDWEVPLI